MGGRLASALLERGWEVHAVVRPGSAELPKREIVGHVYDGTAGAVRRIASDSNPAVVFHLAASGGASEAADVDAILQANLALGTQLLAALSGLAGVAFINTSTFFQHATGTSAYAPVSLYAASKQAFEDILCYYERAALLHSCSLTLYDTYGPDDPRGKLFSLLDAAARSGAVVDLSPGEQIIHAVYVDDVVEGFIQASRLLLSDSANHHGAKYCLDSGKPVSLREAVQAYETATARDVAVNWGGRPYRKFEIFDPWVGERLPGWEPRVTLMDGLRRAFGTANVNSRQ